MHSFYFKAAIQMHHVFLKEIRPTNSQVIILRTNQQIDLYNLYFMSFKTFRIHCYISNWNYSILWTNYFWFIELISMHPIFFSNSHLDLPYFHKGCSCYQVGLLLIQNFNSGIVHLVLSVLFIFLLIPFLIMNKNYSVLLTISIINKNY